MKKLIIFFLTIIPSICFSQNTNSDNLSDELFLMFYNVENLFDTIDNPNTKDEEFLPLSEKKWDSYRYNYKLNQLEKVFNEIIEKENENNLPDIIGLCEVENKFVIEDLLKTDVFKNHNYSIIHKQSPDGRGIDCALLVNSKFEVLQNDFIQINNPKESRTTRDIVYSSLKFKNKIINVFVNHWPSRWGGQEASNYKRVFVAEVLRKYIDENTSQNDFNFILGDFNDELTDPINQNVFLNFLNDSVNYFFTDLYIAEGPSSNWSFPNWPSHLDHILVSNEVLDFNIETNTLKLDDYMIGGWQKYDNYISDHRPVGISLLPNQ